MLCSWPLVGSHAFEEMGQIVKREYDTLTSLNHPYIIKAIDYLSERGQAIIVLEYFHGETLTRAVRTSSAKTGLLTEGRARRIFQMLVSAVEYLHARHIIHRDIKGDNVFLEGKRFNSCLIARKWFGFSHACFFSTALRLVSANFDDLRLIDFNVAGRLLEGDSLTVTGTQEYWPPELFRDVTARSIWESSSVAGKAGDIWSAGLCLHLLITGQLPKRAADFKNAEAFKEAVATKPVTCQDASWKEISIPGRDVLQRCMQMEPQLRPTAEVPCTGLLEQSVPSFMHLYAYSTCALAPGLRGSFGRAMVSRRLGRRRVGPAAGALSPDSVARLRGAPMRLTRWSDVPSRGATCLYESPRLAS